MQKNATFFLVEYKDFTKGKTFIFWGGYKHLSLVYTSNGVRVKVIIIVGLYKSLPSGDNGKLKM